MSILRRIGAYTLAAAIAVPFPGLATEPQFTIQRVPTREDIDFTGDGLADLAVLIPGITTSLYVRPGYERDDGSIGYQLPKYVFTMMTDRLAELSPVFGDYTGNSGMDVLFTDGRSDYSLVITWSGDRFVPRLVKTPKTEPYVNG